MRDIDGFAICEAADLRPIIDAFARLTWPRSLDVLPEFAATLGWEMTGPRVARTTLTVNHPDARVGLLKDGIAEVRFAVSDTLPWDDEIDQVLHDRVRAAYRAIRAEIGSIMGDSHGFRGGRYAASWWNLDSGGRVRLADLERSVNLTLASKEMADIERTEARFGISPDRVAE